MKAELKPGAAFYQYFEKIYGPRWGDLFEALRKPEKQVARWNRWALRDPASEQSPEQEREVQASATQDLSGLHPALRGCHWISPEAQRQPQRAGAEDLLETYIMDPASVIVGRALEVHDGDRVLDMCAAPGGKSLILMEELPTSGELFANDLSPERRDRLKKVIQQYVPRRIRDRLWINGKDGVQFGLREPDSFDKVLLDAPCSGERHVLENKKAQEEWSPRRGENLATRQYALLCAALLAAKPGGRIVYSTCSINPAENDGVVDKLLRKKKDTVREIPSETFSLGEKTNHGVIFLPDACGFGPLYYAVLEKTGG
jgi:16S rRNA C967 or C1407 C5-methylase (RsmB/RsmF family)